MLLSLLGVFGAVDVGTSWCAGKAWHLFRAGARVTFFGAKKVTTAPLAARTAKPARRASAESASQENISSPILNCNLKRSRDFSMRRPASSKNGARPVRRPPGLLSRSSNAVAWISIGRISFHLFWQFACDGVAVWNLFRTSRLANNSLHHRSCAVKGQRPDETSDMEHYPLVGDPKGDAQDVHRFSMRQGCLIEKSRLHLSS